MFLYSFAERKNHNSIERSRELEAKDMPRGCQATERLSISEEIRSSGRLSEARELLEGAFPQRPLSERNFCSRPAGLEQGEKLPQADS